MKNVVNMKNVSWRKDGKTILENINWQVLDGQHWAVLGLNGSGKTSLLTMLNGYMWPTTGNISILGQAFGETDLRILRQSIGWVSSSLQERVNKVQETVDIVVSGKYASIGLYEVPTEEDYKKVHNIMKKLGCSHLIGRSYETCSNGEKQKILIARSLMANPKLLILDEPSNGLDFIAREELMATVNQLANSDDAPTIILVTHHIEEIIPIFTHTLLLKDGTIFDQGKSENMLNQPTLSSFFDKDVQVQWQNERAWLSLQA